MIGDIIASVLSYRENSLLCDGSAIPDGEDYDELRSIIGPNTPDFRDMFLRGNRLGRDLLSYEADGNKFHHHSYSVSAFTKVATGSSTNVATSTRSANTGDAGNSEVTVKNKSVNFFIVYKEVSNSLTQEDFNNFIASNSEVAKKDDLQYTDSANKTWELMDLITANLPFRYSD